MAKELMFKGKKAEEITKLSMTEFALLLPARSRRSLKRGFTEDQKKLLENLKKGEKDPKTQCRDMVIVPEMVNKIIKVYNGKEFVMVTVTLEMLGHRLGEFSQTRKKVAHSAPGIGATRSSASMSVK